MAISPSSSGPWALGNHESIFYSYKYAYSGHFISMEAYSLWSFVTGFFPLP